jgi:hypothetical protein
MRPRIDSPALVIVRKSGSVYPHELTCAHQRTPARARARAHTHTHTHVHVHSRACTHTRTQHTHVASVSCTDQILLSHFIQHEQHGHQAGANAPHPHLLLYSTHKCATSPLCKSLLGRTRDLRLEAYRHVRCKAAEAEKLVCT